MGHFFHLALITGLCWFPSAVAHIPTTTPAPTTPPATTAVDTTISCYVCTDASYDCQYLTSPDDFEVSGCDACGIVQSHGHHIDERICFMGPTCSEVDESSYTDLFTTFSCCDDGDLCNGAAKHSIPTLSLLAFMVLNKFFL